MLTLSEIEARLAKVGMRNRFFGRAEIRELRHIIVQDEQIMKVVNGSYADGFAMLLATDRRLLLIDKKPFFLSLEDIRYDMISEVDYMARLMDATVFIRTINKMLRFSSIRQQKLRDLTHYVQERIMQLRQSHEWQTEHPGAALPAMAAAAEPPALTPDSPPAAAPENPAVPSLIYRPFPATPLTIRRRL